MRLGPPGSGSAVSPGGDCVRDSVQHVGRPCCPGINSQQRSAPLSWEVTRSALKTSVRFKYWTATSFWRARCGGVGGFGSSECTLWYASYTAVKQR